MTALSSKTMLGRAALGDDAAHAAPSQPQAISAPTQLDLRRLAAQKLRLEKVLGQMKRDDPQRASTVAELRATDISLSAIRKAYKGEFEKLISIGPKLDQMIAILSRIETLLSTNGGKIK